MELDSILLICFIVSVLTWYIVIPYRKMKQDQKLFHNDYPSPNGPVKVSRPDKSYVQKTQMRMPNGAISWAETHHEIVCFIQTRLDRDEDDDCPVMIRQKEHGTGGVIELGIDWTDEFEETHIDVSWGEEMDWHDEIEKFLTNKLQ